MFDEILKYELKSAGFRVVSGHFFGLVFYSHLICCNDLKFESYFGNQSLAQWFLMLLLKIFATIYRSFNLF